MRRGTSCCSCCCRDLSVLCCSLSPLYSQEAELKHRRIEQKKHFFGGDTMFWKCSRNHWMWYSGGFDKEGIAHRLDSWRLFPTPVILGLRLYMTEKSWENPLLLERTDFCPWIAENQDKKFMAKEADRQKNGINELSMGTEGEGLKAERQQWDDLHGVGCCCKSGFLHTDFSFVTPSSVWSCIRRPPQLKVPHP